MKIGDLELIPISDGMTYGDGGGAFGLVPKNIWEKKLPGDPQNRVPMILRCLLVRTPQALILIDTGMGDKVTPEIAEMNNFRLERPQGWLLDRLAAHGVAAEDIDIVILTHLHGDHSGGCTRFIDGHPLPTFPKAQYWVQEREWTDAHRINERTCNTYYDFNFDPLEQAGQLRLVNGKRSVTSGIRLVPAPGHTAGLQIVILESGGQTAAFMSDVAFFHWQIEKLAWVSAYDIDPMTTIETKRIWQPWLAERQATIIFQHDPLVEMGCLIENEGRFRVQSLYPLRNA